MRDTTLATNTVTPSRPQEPSAVATEVDADFLRHSRALASQIVMTRADVLQFTAADRAISHW